MKKTLVLLLMVFMVSQAFGLGIKVGVGGDMGLPQGDWKYDLGNNMGEFVYTPGNGFGGSIFAVVDIMVLKLTADLGYISFGKKTYELGTEKADISASAIPVLVGLRYDIGAPVGPKVHLGLKLGYTFFAYTISGLSVPVPMDDEGKFTFAPYVGVSLMTFELTGHYMIIDKANYIGLRLAFALGIGA